MAIEQAHNLQSAPITMRKTENDKGLITLSNSSAANSRAPGVGVGLLYRYGAQFLLGAKEGMKQAFGIESFRFFNESGEFEPRIRRPFEPAVPLLDLLAIAPDLPPATAVLGLTEDGRPLTHTFSADSNPNILISGDEGAGKTVLLRTIAASLALQNKQADVQLLAINPVSADRERHDAHEITYRELSYLPHMLTAVATRQTEINELLLFLARETSYRQENDFTLPRIVLLIDQAATVLEHGGRTVKQAIQTVAERGPRSGIYVAVSTRRPAQLTPDLATNLQTRFLGQMDVHIAQESRTPPAEIEATTLLGEGDFLAAGSRQNLRFQAAYIESSAMHARLAQLYGQRPILLAKPLDEDVKLEQEKKLQAPKKKQQSFLNELASAAT